MTHADLGMYSVVWGSDGGTWLERTGDWKAATGSDGSVGVSRQWQLWETDVEREGAVVSHGGDGTSREGEETDKFLNFNYKNQFNFSLRKSWL